MDVPGLACSPGVGICKRDTLSHCCMRFLPPYPFSSRERVLIAFHLFPFVFIVYSLKAIYKNWNHLYKMRTGVGVEWGGSLFFSPLKGGTSLSKEKKACCTRLAGSDRSQRRFACCHSQSKMPPLPRSQSATFLFCVPEMHPSCGPGFVGLARRSPCSSKVIFQPQEVG